MKLMYVSKFVWVGLGIWSWCWCEGQPFLIVIASLQNNTPIPLTAPNDPNMTSTTVSFTTESCIWWERRISLRFWLLLFGVGSTYWGIGIFSVYRQNYRSIPPYHRNTYQFRMLFVYHLIISINGYHRSLRHKGFGENSRWTGTIEDCNLIFYISSFGLLG